MFKLLKINILIIFLKKDLGESSRKYELIKSCQNENSGP